MQVGKDSFPFLLPEEFEMRRRREEKEERKRKRRENDRQMNLLEN